MDNHVSSSSHVVVIGAGIIGLQAALHLQEAGYAVTIIAEHIPGDEDPYYTSPWAGAQWRTHAKPGDEEQQRWDLETYRAWLDMVRRGVGERSGLGTCTSTLYWFSSTISESSPDLWWHSAVEDFTFLPSSDLPGGVKSGVQFTTICANVPRHLSYLLSSFMIAGGRVLRSHLSKESSEGFLSVLESAKARIQVERLGEVHCFVNATGLAAKTLVGDESMFPTRGQTVLVKGESQFAKTTDDNHYVIPRPGSGTTVLGGTREDGNWSIKTSEVTTKSILEGCRLLAPELLDKNGEFEVLSVQCGFRPSRTRGARVELEFVDGKYPVVHSYGHAGAGYQNAIGSSRKVVGLVKNLDAHRSLKAKI